MAGTVTVACKLPMGLILELPGRPKVELNKSRVRQGEVPIDVGGFSITPNVDEDFFNAWLKAYAGLDLVQKNLIFALPKTHDLKSKAAEMAELKSGLEPINGEKPGPGLEKVSA